MKKLSLRERILVYIMIILLVAVVGYNLIQKPTESILSQAQMDQAAAYLEHEQLTGRISHIEERQQAYDTAIQYYDEHKDDYPDNDYSWDMERSVLACLTSHNLNPTSDSIGVGETQVISLPSIDTVATDTEDASMGITTSNMTAVGADDTQSVDSTIGGVYNNSFSMTLRGTWADFESFLKQAYEDPTFHVVSYSVVDVDLPVGAMQRNISSNDINYQYDVIINYITSVEGSPIQ